MPVDPRSGMDSRVRQSATAPPDAFNIVNPSPTPGSGGEGDTGFGPRLAEGEAVMPQGSFTPGTSESADTAGVRVRNAVRAIVRGNGGEPADLG